MPVRRAGPTKFFRIKEVFRSSARHRFAQKQGFLGVFGKVIVAQTNMPLKTLFWVKMMMAKELFCPNPEGRTSQSGCACTGRTVPLVRAPEEPSPWCALQLVLAFCGVINDNLYKLPKRRYIMIIYTNC